MRSPGHWVVSRIPKMPPFWLAEKGPRCVCASHSDPFLSSILSQGFCVSNYRVLIITSQQSLHKLSVPLFFFAQSVNSSTGQPPPPMTSNKSPATFIWFKAAFTLIEFTRLDFHFGTSINGGKLPKDPLTRRNNPCVLMFQWTANLRIFSKHQCEVGIQ